VASSSTPNYENLGEGKFFITFASFCLDQKKLSTEGNKENEVLTSDF